jgi:hypothetical protein
MTSNFESETMELLRRLKLKKESAEKRYAAELEAIDKEIAAVSITLRLLRESPLDGRPASAVEETVIPKSLFGKSAREACIEIAKRNNGIVRVGDAKKALLAANILKESKNTWAIIYTTLKRSKEFEKGERTGEFRLVDQEQARLIP